jgi:sugar-specific transcriptional regulator TrmB
MPTYLSLAHMDLHNLQKLLQTLNEIGLTANEANAYIGLLSVGTNPVSVIAKKSAINRCTCYTILERLMNKGFVNSYIKDNITYYTAIEPKYLLEQLKNSRFELEDRISNLGNCIANFELLKKEYCGKPKVVFFEGVAGVQNVMEDTLNSKGIIRAYASLSELTDLLPDYWPSYYRRRTERAIFVKSIYPADETSIRHKQRDKEELRESRLVPKEFDFHLDFLIYDDKVAITSLVEKFGVLIESHEMAESHKKIFDFIWEGTRQYDTIVTKMMKKPDEQTPSDPATSKNPEKMSVKKESI